MSSATLHREISSTNFQEYRLLPAADQFSHKREPATVPYRYVHTFAMNHVNISQHCVDCPVLYSIGQFVHATTMTLRLGADPQSFYTNPTLFAHRTHGSRGTETAAWQVVY